MLTGYWANSPQADRQDTILDVWFHDIGRVRGHEHKHAKHGAIAAFEYLTGHGYDSDRTQRVHDACKAHSCNDVMPHSLEGQILATADGMSHFMNGFYLRIFQLSSAKRGFEAATERVRNTIEKDYRIKIHFDFAHAAVEEQYHTYLRAFSF